MERTRRDRIVIALLASLFFLAVLYTLYVARELLIPFTIAFLAALLLSRPLAWLQRMGLPRVLGAALLVAALAGSVIYGLYALAVPALEWSDRAPLAAARLEYRLRLVRGPLQDLREAAQKIEKIAQEQQAGEEKEEVQVVEADLADSIMARLRALSTMGVVIAVLLYFMLCYGRRLTRHLAQAVSESDLRLDARQLLSILQATESDLSRYALTITVINALLGVATGLVVYATGIGDPLLFGAMAMLFNYVPYIGAMLGTGVIFVAGLLTFESLGIALLPACLFIVLTTLEGYFITPTVLGKRFSVSPLLVFVALLFWGWLWGVAGAILSAPLLVTFKVLCEHIVALRPLGRALGFDLPDLVEPEPARSSEDGVGEKSRY